jgi:ribose 5-phosphate isomerase A
VAQDPDPRAAAKRAAAEAAVERYVTSGMRIGLGTGSTAVWAVRRIGALLADGTLVDVVGVPTSPSATGEAVAAGIPLTTLDEAPRLHVTVDGADQVSAALDLIKGGGGAHLHEKVVAQASDRLVIVVDEPKLVPLLGAGFPVPVEVVPFARCPEAEHLESLGATVTLRSSPGGEPYVTAEGNVVLDADFGPIDDPADLLARLDARAGVAAVGLFLAMASVVVVAGADGSVRELRPERVSRGS